MTGIAALAAAAAATQKIPGTAGVTTIPVSGIKVVTPTIVTPTGVKVTPIPGKIQGQQGTIVSLLYKVLFALIFSVCKKDY